MSSRDGKPTVLTQDRQFFRLSGRDFEDPPSVLTRIPLPRSGSVPAFRRDVASRSPRSTSVRRRTAAPAVDPKVEKEAARLGDARVRASVPEVSRAREARALGRARERDERRLGGVERRIRVRTETLARQFDRVLSVLRDLGYVNGWSLTAKGRTLTRIYGEGTSW